MKLAAQHGGDAMNNYTAPISAERKRLHECLRVVVKASREDADVGQKELARRLEVTRNVIANLETGRRVMTAADFVMIARALHINAETLLRRVLQW
jgi:ribosome-binding protein aMBF1 (putative translation factor)